jgi:hypothetical protein
MRRKRLGIFLALLGAASLTLISRGGDFKTEDFKGRVLPLATVLEKFKAKLDPDAVAHSLVLVTYDGKIFPLLKDGGARMFFKDPVLLNRPMRLTGRLIPGSGILQVVNVQSYRKGQLHEVYYWCDICTIRAYEKGACGCCGAPLELREVPVKK